VTSRKTKKRVLRLPLPVVPGAWLPEIGWSGTAGHRPCHPDRFTPIRNPPDDKVGKTPFESKPARSGLWCTPTIRAKATGELVGTWWTTVEYAKDRGYGTVTLIHPDPGVKVLVIHRREHLFNAVRRWPDRRQPASPINRWSGWRPYTLDWESMARDVDAVFLTGHGVRQLNTPGGPHEPHLWGWDAPTVLFLTPRFTVGDTSTLDGTYATLLARQNALRDELLDIVLGGGEDTFRAAVEAWHTRHHDDFNAVATTGRDSV
jgi:hypothetical protein